MLTAAGVGPLLVNLHHHAERVEAFLAAHPHRDLIQTVREPELLGTGGTVLANRGFFGDEAFMVVHADNLSRFDVAAFLERHRRRPPGCLATMLTFETDAPETCGIVEVDSEGVVQSFTEKPESSTSRLANGAVYVFEPPIFSILEKMGKRPIDLSTEVIPLLVGRMVAYHNGIYHRDIGTPSSYAQAQIEDAYLPPEA